MNVDGLLGLGEHSADRQLGALPVGDGAFEELALGLAGQGDHDGACGKDRGAGQGYSRHWRVERQRVRKNSDGAAGLRRIER